MSSPASLVTQAQVVSLPFECLMCGAKTTANIPVKVRTALVAVDGFQAALAPGHTVLARRAALRIARRALELVRCPSCKETDSAFVTDFWMERILVAFALAALPFMFGVGALLEHRKTGLPVSELIVVDLVGCFGLAGMIFYGTLAKARRIWKAAQTTTFE